MASSNPEIRTLSARKAALVRHRGNSTETAAALAVEQLAEYVKRVVAQAPPLTAEQRDRIAALLRGGAAA